MLTLSSYLGLATTFSDFASLDNRVAMHLHTLVIGTDEPDLQRLCRLSCPGQGHPEDRQTFRDRREAQRVDFWADLID